MSFSEVDLGLSWYLEADNGHSLFIAHYEPKKLANKEGSWCKEKAWFNFGNRYA